MEEIESFICSHCGARISIKPVKNIQFAKIDGKIQCVCQSCKKLLDQNGG